MVPKLSLRKRIVAVCADNTFIHKARACPLCSIKLTRNNAQFNLSGTTALTINPASTIAASAGAEGSVQTVSLSNGEAILALGSHADRESIEAVVFVNIIGAVDGTSTPAGLASLNMVITGATDSMVCIWVLKMNRLHMMLKHKVSPAFCSPLTFTAWQLFFMLIE